MAALWPFLLIKKPQNYRRAILGQLILADRTMHIGLDTEKSAAYIFWKIDGLLRPKGQSMAWRISLQGFPQGRFGQW